jgi:hypothetical protein
MERKTEDNVSENQHAFRMYRGTREAILWLRENNTCEHTTARVVSGLEKKAIDNAQWIIVL